MKTIEDIEQRIKEIDAILDEDAISTADAVALNLERKRHIADLRHTYNE